MASRVAGSRTCGHLTRSRGRGRRLSACPTAAAALPSTSYACLAQCLPPFRRATPRLAEWAALPRSRPPRRAEGALPTCPPPECVPLIGRALLLSLLALTLPALARADEPSIEQRART